MVSEQTNLSENHKHEQKTSLAAAYTVLQSQDPWQKSCLSHDIDCWTDEKPPCVYNNNSLSTDTWAVAVIFRSPQQGNIDICKSTEGIRQGFLPPAVHGLRRAGSTRSSVEVC